MLAATAELPTAAPRPFAFKGRGESLQRGREGVPPPAPGPKAPPERGVRRRSAWLKTHSHAQPPGVFPRRGEEKPPMRPEGDARQRRRRMVRTLPPAPAFPTLKPIF